MAEDHDQSGIESCRAELDAPDLRRRDDVARNPDDEQVSETLVEHDLGRNPRIGAAENDGERLLLIGQLGASADLRHVGPPNAGGKPQIAVAEPLKRFARWNHDRRSSAGVVWVFGSQGAIRSYGRAAAESAVLARTARGGARSSSGLGAGGELCGSGNRPASVQQVVTDRNEQSASGAGRIAAALAAPHPERRATPTPTALIIRVTIDSPPCPGRHRQ
jgi:hypothetical protein